METDILENETQLPEGQDANDAHNVIDAQQQQEEQGDEPLSSRLTGLAYAESMTKHKAPQIHPESPKRIQGIWQQLRKDGHTAQCVRVKADPGTDDMFLTIHNEAHCQVVQSCAKLTKKELLDLSQKFNSIYLNKFSPHSAAVAVGHLVELTKKVALGELRNGAAVIRPPGHHAECHTPMGFCLYNNVAIAAVMARKYWQADKILIVDFDVHHGNGTQNSFFEDPSVLYFSVHRYDEGAFYPNGEGGAPTTVGTGAGEGFSVNVGWNRAGMGDSEYIAAFREVLMPIAEEFDPDLVLVSAGFDAAEGDPLGGCRVTPPGYAHMIHMLQSLANGRVVVALEGGYNVRSISHSMSACVGALLGNPLPRLPLEEVDPSAMVSIRKTQTAHHTHWKRINSPAPADIEAADLATNMQNVSLQTESNAHVPGGGVAFTVDM